MEALERGVHMVQETPWDSIVVQDEPLEAGKHCRSGIQLVMRSVDLEVLQPASGS
jgi:hypothetical protein